MSRGAIFDAIRAVRTDKRFNVGEVVAIDALLDQLAVPRDNQRRVSSAMIGILKGLEGVRLTAYPDPATGGDPWTIGVGHTGPDVHPGLTITPERCDELLRADLAKFETGVEAAAPKTTQGQFDALVSIAFNVGLGALHGSTLLKLHNQGKYAAAALEFGRWNKANGKVMSGLTRRRMTEAQIYKGGPA